jgi:hypothetical protein
MLLERGALVAHELAVEVSRERDRLGVLAAVASGARPSTQQCSTMPRFHLLSLDRAGGSTVHR